MHPVVLRWGPFSVYAYTAAVSLGIMVAVAYVHWRGSLSGFSVTYLLDGALWTIAGGIVGARLAYVLAHREDFSGGILDLWSRWDGGLVFQGGLLGGLVVLYLYSVYTQVSALRLVDLAAPAVALAQALGWAGALLHGANYGLIMRSPISMWLPDLYGVYGPRIPTQLLGSFLGLGLFYTLHRASCSQHRPGLLGLLYVFGNGVGHFLLGFARSDQALYVGMLRSTQLAELVEASVAGSCLSICWWFRRYRANTSAQTDGTDGDA